MGSETRTRSRFDWQESLRVALRCGVSVAEYNDLTPRELLMIVEEYNAHRQLQREDMLTQAYITAYMHRVKRMPTLKKVLEDAKLKKRAEPQTPEQMFAEVKRMHAKLAREEG